MAINDSSDVPCFDVYLINIFVKSTKAERCTHIIVKLTLYCVSVTVKDLNLQQRYRYKDINVLDTCYFIVLDSTLGAQYLSYHANCMDDLTFSCVVSCLVCPVKHAKFCFH